MEDARRHWLQPGVAAQHQLVQPVHRSGPDGGRRTRFADELPRQPFAEVVAWCVASEVFRDLFRSEHYLYGRLTQSCQQLRTAAASLEIDGVFSGLKLGFQ